MGTQHAHRVVVEKNTTTEDTYNNTEKKHREYRSSVNHINGLHKHAQ